MMSLEEIRAFKPQILAKAEECGIERVRIALPVDPKRAHLLGDVTFIITPLPETGWKIFTFAEDLEHEVMKCKVHIMSDNYRRNEFIGPYIGEVVPL